MGDSKTDDVTTDSSATESDSSATKTDSDIEHENDDVSSPSPDSCPFIEGEKVLAYHGSRIYDAKVPLTFTFRALKFTFKPNNKAFG